MKINLKNTLIFMLAVITSIMFITDWVIAVAFNGTFTVYGIVVNLIEAAIAVTCFDYIDAYLKSKNIK